MHNFIPFGGLWLTRNKGIAIANQEWRSLWRYAWFLLLLNGIFLGFAQSPEHFRNFRRFTPDDGMPASDVRRIMQDSRGFMWFATEDGVVRYDGYEFRVFRHNEKDPDSLADNLVWDIKEAPDGNLWMGTGNGLDLWDCHQEHFVHMFQKQSFAAGLQGCAIRQVLPAADGTEGIWLGTEGAGLFLYYPSTRSLESYPIRSNDSTIVNPVNICSLFRDREGFLWIGTEGIGLIRLDPRSKQFTHYRHESAQNHSLSSDMVNSLAEDHEGYLWIATSKGLCRLDPNRKSLDRILLNPLQEDESEEVSAECVLVDASGIIWVGTDGDGLFRFDNGRSNPRNYSSDPYNPQTLADRIVNQGFQDRKGDMWFSHPVGHVSFTSKFLSGFQLYRFQPDQPNGLSDRAVSGFMEEPSGLLWICTGKGLDRLDLKSGQWSHIRHKTYDTNSLSSDDVLTLIQDHAGLIWIGTWNAGLNCYDPATGKFQRYLPEDGRPDSLGSTHVWRIAEDQSHQLWVATIQGGLNRFLPAEGRFTRYTNAPGNVLSLNHNNVWSLLVTRNGSVWAGTFAGLARWEPNSDTWKRYQSDGKPGNLSDNWVVDLHEDRNGILWIATYRGGLNRFDPKTGQFECFGFPKYLPSDVVAGILEDEDGFLWLSTNNGLVRFDPRTKQTQVYDQADGLQGQQFSRKARLRLSNGELLFGGPNGFNRFNPRTLLHDTNMPKVVLTRLEIRGKEIRPGGPIGPLSQSITETKKLTIHARDSAISIQFAAPGSRQPHRIRYRYRLENFDKEWQTTGRERRATYTNLDPGRYGFQVQAANREGQWSEQEAILYLEIQPYWWQSWWFRIAAALGLTSGVVLMTWNVAFRGLRKKLREVEQARQLAVERRESAEALQQSEMRYHLLFDNANDGICVVRDGLVKELNTRLAVILGRPYDAIRGQPIAHFIASSDVALVVERSQNRLQNTGKIPSSYAFRVLQPDHSETWVELNVAVFEWEGKPATLNVIRDLTERKLAEKEQLLLQQQLIQAQKMEAIGQLAGGVAHDFNNILAVILMQLELLREDKNLNYNAQEALKDLVVEAERAANLTRQLLMFGRRSVLEVRVLDLNEVVTNLLKMLGRLLGEHIKLDFKHGNTLPLLEGDTGMLEQVLMNLCVNARDAMPKGGNITISTDAISLDVKNATENSNRRPGCFVCLSVTDTGCGMDKDTLQRIFEPFFTTKEVGKGTGLGLATVYGIISQHQGWIEVESQVDCGTTFRIFLPASGKTLRVTVNDNQEITAKGSETILLVEDESNVRRMLAKTMRANGYNVLEAGNGNEAMDLWQQHQQEIDLLFTDVVMPGGVTGIELAEKFRTENPQLKIIISSGYSDEMVTQGKQSIKEITYFPKPYQISTVGATLRKCLDSK